MSPPCTHFSHPSNLSEISSLTTAVSHFFPSCMSTAAYKRSRDRGSVNEGRPHPQRNPLIHHPLGIPRLSVRVVSCSFGTLFVLALRSSSPHSNAPPNLHTTHQEKWLLSLLPPPPSRCVLRCDASETMTRSSARVDGRATLAGFFFFVFFLSFGEIMLDRRCNVHL